MIKMFVDCHTHILNEIDDGAQSREMAVEMINRSIAQGVKEIWFTPHFNAANDSAEAFLNRRNSAYNKLAADFRNRDISFVCGSEVLLCEALFNLPRLNGLCINGGAYMLVEFSRESTVSDILRMLNTLINRLGIIPIIAHVERYRDIFLDNKVIKTLLWMGCRLQMSSGVFEASLYENIIALMRIHRNEITVMGSDCHNISTRPPNLKHAMDYIDLVIGKKFADRLNENALEISNAQENRVIFA